MAIKRRPAKGRTGRAKRRTPTRIGRTASGSKTKRAAPKDPLARAKALAERGAFGEAILTAEALLDADPRYWPARQFVAFTLWRRGYPKQAMMMLESAIMTAPDTAEAQTDLASSLVMAAQQSSLMTDRAIELAEKTMARHGPTASLLQGLSVLFLRRGDRDKAAATAERAVSLFPDNTAPRLNLSVVLLLLGREEEALAAYASILKPIRPNTTPSASEVVHQYAKLAGGYDDNALHQLFSERMAKFIADALGSTSGKTVLDAGCGTGLLGTRIEAGRLVGIDLSPDMLAAARARGVYDELIEGDLVEAMAGRQDRFDLVASSCVLYHIADLAPYFRQASRLLVPGGHLFFSVDPAPDNMGIALSAHGEYAHSRAYLRHLAAETGFSEVAIAIMGHRATPGFWCAFRKGPLENETRPT
ncbi:MAG: methyltransferase domain-containing protein [Rhodospirillales bacterium]|nr:methyltransferase domain-containing protein [Rhodospirillales bacterium]